MGQHLHPDDSEHPSHGHDQTAHHSGKPEHAEAEHSLQDCNSHPDDSHTTCEDVVQGEHKHSHSHNEEAHSHLDQGCEHSPPSNLHSEKGCDYSHEHSDHSQEQADRAHSHEANSHSHAHHSHAHAEKGQSHDAHSHGHAGHHHHHHGHLHVHFEDVPDGHPTLLSQRHFRVLRWVFALTFLYLIVEVVGGYISGSLALLADGFHMFGDAGAIGISLFAQWYSHRPSPEYRTFGYQRLEILAAFFNALSLVLMGIFILYESYERFQHPVAVQANLMMVIAVGGLIINIISAKLLHGDHEHNLNIKGAYLHVLGDLLGSVGAIAAGVLIWAFHWYLADPIISGIIAVLIIYSAIGLLKEATSVLLEGCPSHIDITKIRAAILNFDGVQEVHHLHVWNINLQRIVLTAHLEVAPNAFSGETLTRVQEALKTQFGLSHVTLQLELA